MGIPAKSEERSDFAGNFKLQTFCLDSTEIDFLTVYGILLLFLQITCIFPGNMICYSKNV